MRRFYISCVVLILALSVILGCLLSSCNDSQAAQDAKENRIIQLNDSALSLYTRAIDAENWRFKYAGIGDSISSARWQRVRDSLSTQADSCIDLAKKVKDSLTVKTLHK